MKIYESDESQRRLKQINRLLIKLQQLHQRQIDCNDSESSEQIKQEVEATMVVLKNLMNQPRQIVIEL